MKKRDWKQVWKSFEAEMTEKMERLPGHKETPDNLREYRSIISHELPESTPIGIYEKMIAIILKGEEVNIDWTRKEILEPELKREDDLLKRNRIKIRRLQEEALAWVRMNLSENKLQRLWKEHKTWLPRRYTIYKNPNTSFQKIASDTLARCAVLME